MRKRILAFILCVCCCFVGFPINTLAEDEKTVAVEQSDAKLTEEQLYMLAPSYLRSEAYDSLIAKGGDMALDAINSVSSKDEAIAAYMQGLKEGKDILWQKLWSSCGLTDSMYTEFEVAAAKEVLTEYLSVEDFFTKTAEKTGKELKVITTFYDLKKEDDKSKFVKELKKTKSSLSDEKIDEMVSALFKEADKIEKYTSNSMELFATVFAFIDMQMIELQALDDLIVIHNQVNDTTMRDALVKLRYEITTDIGTHIVTSFFTDKVMSKLQGMVEDAVKDMAGDAFQFGALETKVGELAVKAIVNIYEKYKPTVSDIVYSSLLYQYWIDSNMAVTHYQHLFYMGKGTEDDIRLCEAAVNFNAVCTKILLNKSKNLVKGSNKRLYNKMDCWESSLGSEINYNLYINSCISRASKAVTDGTLLIEDNKAVQKDQNGNVIDEKYDSTESILAKFEVIQSQYKPNIGQTWNADWGGAIQCFGFARMVFYQLFGCNMPARYDASARYKYRSTDNVNLIGQLEESNVTVNNVKNLFQQGKIGDVIQASGAVYGQHTMIFVSADEKGVTVYDCNAKLNSSEPACAIHQWTINWDKWVSFYGTGDSTSKNGISLYRAVNYAQIYGDGEELFYDDSVNFVIENGVLKKYNGWQTMVEIPDTVTEIGDSAFKGNTTMLSVNIPDSVTKIGDSAFAYCSSLLGIVIPDSVEEIGKNAFDNCRSMASVSLPINDKFTEIKIRTFINCNALKQVSIPDNIIKIGFSAFSDCSGLTYVKLSQNLKELGGNTFRRCVGLTEIKIPKSLEKASDTWDKVGEIGEFYGCDNLKDVSFEDGLSVITPMLFYNCNGIEKLEMPDTVTEIGNASFAYCESLSSVKFSPNVSRIGNRAFISCNKLIEVEIPDSVEKIDFAAFSDCSGLTRVQLSKNLKELGGNTFRRCIGLTEIEIPKSLKKASDSWDETGEIGEFYGCDNLKSVSLEDGIASIAPNLFYNCNSLEKIEMPDTITEIGDNSFAYCEKLNDVKISSNVTQIGNRAFISCVGLKEIEIPDSVEKIGYAAFSDCTGLIHVDLSENLKELGGNTFRRCVGLTEIKIPKSLIKASVSCDEIGKAGEFYGCNNLKNISFEEKVDTVIANLFYYCSGIEKIVLPDTVTKIEKNAFSNCENLREITIPESVNEIADDEFSYPDNMTIFGKSGSYAEMYAKGKNIKFIALGTPATSVSISETNKSIKIGETVQLQINVEPENFTDKIIWESSVPEVATVTEDGYVTGIEEGNTIIKATVGELSAECTLTVVKEENPSEPEVVPATGITISENEKTVKVGDQFTLEALVEPANSTESVIWTSSDENVAAVTEEGNVNALNTGETVITASIGAFSASCKLTVVAELKKIELKNGSTVSINGNNTLIYGENLSKVLLNSEGENKATFVEQGTDVEVQGKLTWKNSSQIPNAGIVQGVWVFKPEQSQIYEEKSGEVEITVQKATPVIGQLPVAESIVYGQLLSDSVISLGEVHNEINATMNVDGTFIWKERETKPCVADSNQTVYSAIFVPDNEDNYNQVETELTLEVKKAQIAPNVPQKVIKPVHSVKTVGEVSLNEDWNWQQTDAQKQLVDEESVTAVAVYNGSDAGNYEIETMEITLIRSKCEHEYVESITKEATRYEEGVLTHICSKCGESYTSSIPKITDEIKNDTIIPDNSESKIEQGNNENSKKSDNSISAVVSAIPDRTEPYLKNNGNTSGWEAIKQVLNKTKEKETIVIEMRGKTVIPADVIRCIKDKDINIVFEFENDISWRINGKSIKSEIEKDIDFATIIGEQAGGTIPVDVINTITGEKQHLNLSLSYNGEFGFTAVLILNMGVKNAGLYANLFYYNEETKSLEYVCDGIVDNSGKVELPFTHASDYVIVLDTQSRKNDSQHQITSEISPKTGENENQPEIVHGENNVIILIVILTAVLIMAFLARKKKIK